MSKYVPELFNHVGKLYQIEERERSLDQEKSENQDHIEDAIKKIFENGIIPVAQRRGYGLSVRVQSYNNEPVSWEEFTDAKEFHHYRISESDSLKKRVKDYSNERSVHKGLSIVFDLMQYDTNIEPENRVLKQFLGTFYLSEDPPKLSIEIHPIVPNSLKHEHLPHGEYRIVSADKIEKDLEDVINEYESSIVPKFIQNKPVPQ